MMRQVLIAWWPWLVCLLAACAVLIAVARMHRRRLDLGRLRWRRLVQLHRNEAGSAQTLSFVLTLPVFLLVILFIVQVSQIMIGLVVVQYSAYAAARSASVWIPAWVDDGGEWENCLGFHAPDPLAPEQYFPILDVTDPNYGPTAGGVTYLVDGSNSAKFEKIREAAVLACVPISPSRSTEASLSGSGATLADLLTATFGAMAPSAQSGPAVARRMRNKVAYAMANTRIELRFFHPNAEPPLLWYFSGAYPGLSYDDDPHPDEFREGRELGWQDPVTVTVHYNMALLPGPGRFLAKPAYSPGGGPDQVAQKIDRSSGEYVLPMTASATMGIEGEKSVVPYAYPVY